MRLTILAEADPLAVVRILQMISSLNLLPERMCAERLGDETIRIELDLPRHERLHRELFCKRVLAIPTVMSLARDGAAETFRSVK